MRALIIDAQTKQKVKDLIQLAAAEPYSLVQLKALAEGFDPKNPETRKCDVRINEKFTIDIPMGYTVTYTQEYQPTGLHQHLSVSVPTALYPNPAAVQEIMTLFGFTKTLKESIVWEEKYAKGFSAINVMEEVKTSCKK